MLETAWTPPAELSRQEIIAASEEVRAVPDIPLVVREDVFRIRALEMDWDIGGKVYQPQDPDRIAVGADGKKAGIFMLHGGAADHRWLEPLALLLAGKFGFKVATMTFPGKLYLLDPSRDWPGDTINPDGTARTPLWSTDQRITPDQHELIQDRSDPAKRAKWGTLFFLRAKEGTEFYDRMAAWPAAFEEGMKEVCRRHFPVGEYSAYLHGHSTGGPFVHMLLQRLENAAGLVGMETSAFGSIYADMMGMRWDFPFNYLTLRTWRHIAKYAGAEAGAEGAKRLPWIMEEVFEAWEKARTYPQFKAEYFVTYGAVDALEQAARASANRLRLNAAQTEALVQRYRGYPYPLRGPGARPVPPLLYGINQGSRDHTLERYRQILLPALARLDAAPRACVVLFRAGVHGYMKPEADLPSGTGPAFARLWHQAITQGYYLGRAQPVLENERANI